MHSLLEDYLAEVRAKLSPLPAKRREDEMREMRQHLLSAMEANRELRQNEDEAATTALMQFGSVEEASESIFWGWRRDVRKKSIISSWRMAGIWTANSIFDGFLWHKQGYGIALFVWGFTMLMILSQYLPAKYQPLWMRRWFVPSKQ